MRRVVEAVNEVETLYEDLCEASEYFEAAVRESEEIIAECSEDLAAELREQQFHFRTALQAMWIVRRHMKCQGKSG